MVRKFLRALLLFFGGIYALGLAGYVLLSLLAGDHLWWLAFLNNFRPWYFVPLLVLVPPLALFRARFLLRLSLVLSLIGVLWFGPRFLPHFLAPATGPTLRVLTFNTEGGNRERDRVEAWLRQMNSDVVLLQEIPESYVSGGLATLKDLYPYQFTQTTTKRWWGNVTLSRFPLLETDKPDMENSDMPVRQRIVINFHGQPVAIYNVHLTLPERGTPYLLSLAEQLKNPFVTMALKYDPTQRDSLITDLLDALAHEPYPYLVAGDFNMSDQTEIYGTLAAHMGDSFREAGWGFGLSWPVAVEVKLPAFIPPLIRIDYIWHSPQWRVVNIVQGPQLGSDHLPLYATLELQTKN